MEQTGMCKELIVNVSINSHLVKNKHQISKRIVIEQFILER